LSKEVEFSPRKQTRRSLHTPFSIQAFKEQSPVPIQEEEDQNLVPEEEEKKLLAVPLSKKQSS